MGGFLNIILNIDVNLQKLALTFLTIPCVLYAIVTQPHIIRQYLYAISLAVTGDSITSNLELTRGIFVKHFKLEHHFPDVVFIHKIIIIINTFFIGSTQSNQFNPHAKFQLVTNGR